MEPPKEEEAVFIMPRTDAKPPLNLPLYLSARSASYRKDLPPLSLAHITGNQPQLPIADALVSSRIAMSFAHFGLSLRDNSLPLPQAQSMIPPVRSQAPLSPHASTMEDPPMNIFTVADLLQLPNLAKEVENRRMTSVEQEQITNQHVYDSWEHAQQYVATSPEQLQRVVAEVRRIVDPRIPSYLLNVASLVFRGLAYVMGIRAPLLIKNFVSDQLRLAVTMGELEGIEVDEYLRHHRTTATNIMVDTFAYHTLKNSQAKVNNANLRQEKNHTTVTKIARPKTISEYLSSHALLDWFVEVDAYLEFLDMTATDQVNVVTSLFRGTIRKWWNHLKPPQKDVIITWPLMRKLMTSEFLPADYINDFYDEVRAIRQTTTVKEYNRKYYALIQDIPDLSQEMAYYHYVAGLKPHIHTFVKVLPIQTLQQAMRQAETFDEAFNKGSNPDALLRQRPQYPKNSNFSGYNRKRLPPVPPKGPAYRPTTSTRPMERKSTAEVKCFNYGRQGYYANRCHQLKKTLATASVQGINAPNNKKKEGLKGVPP